MPIIGGGGIEQVEAAELLLVATQDIFADLGDDAGVRSFAVRNSSQSPVFTLDSLGNVTITGDLLVTGSGSHVIHNTSEIMLADKQLTLNADINEVTQNDDAGIAVKRVSNTAGQVDTATDFDNGTGVITLSGAPTTIIAGDLFYVKGSQDNDGLYKADSVGASDITIDAAATEPGLRLSLVDETGASADVSEAITAFIEFLESTDRWEFGSYGAAAARSAFQMIGIGAGGATAFSDANPDISTQGAAAGSSGAAQVGVFDEFTVATGSTTVQETLKVHDDALNLSDGSQLKSGVESIGNGASTVVVTFGTAFGTSLDVVTATVSNTTDGGPLILPLDITAKATTGFTATLSGNTDSANYDLEWIAIGS